MAEVLPSGLSFRPGIDYPEDPFYEQREREQNYEQQLNQEKVSSRLQQLSQRSEQQVSEISQAFSSGKSLRELRRLVTGATLVALVLLFIEMHLRFLVCNLFGGSIPIMAEDKLGDFEVCVLFFVDWLLMTGLCILLLILIPIVAPQAFAGILIKNLWENVKSSICTFINCSDVNPSI